MAKKAKTQLVQQDVQEEIQQMEAQDLNNSQPRSEDQEENSQDAGFINDDDQDQDEDQQEEEQKSNFLRLKKNKQIKKAAKKQQAPTPIKQKSSKKNQGSQKKSNSVQYPQVIQTPQGKFVYINGSYVPLINSKPSQVRNVGNCIQCGSLIGYLASQSPAISKTGRCINIGKKLNGAGNKNGIVPCSPCLQALLNSFKNTIQVIIANVRSDKQAPGYVKVNRPKSLKSYLLSVLPGLPFNLKSITSFETITQAGHKNLTKMFYYYYQGNQLRFKMCITPDLSGNTFNSSMINSFIFVYDTTLTKWRLLQSDQSPNLLVTTSRIRQSFQQDAEAKQDIKKSKEFMKKSLQKVMKEITFKSVAIKTQSAAKTSWLNLNDFKL